jgi:type I site-specific restriction endonuclease
MNKEQLSERGICTKFITPAVKQAGWDEMLQIREEVGFTKGRIIVHGKLVTRRKAARFPVDGLKRSGSGLGLGLRCRGQNLGQ